MGEKDEFQCLMSMSNLGDYVGKWIAIVGDEIVAIGDKGKDVFQRSKEQFPDEIPLVMKVPENRVMLL